MNEEPNNTPPDTNPSIQGNDNARPASSKGSVLAGLLLGIIGAPVFAAISGAVFQTPAAAIIVAVAVWSWAGYLTAAFAKSSGARAGMAILFAVGFGLLPFVLLAIVCGGLR